MAGNCFSALGRIGSIPVGSAEKPTWLMEATHAVLSPDGKWIVYGASESGRYEVFVSPFPNATDDRVSVSKGGGTVPLWSRDGKELFCLGESVSPAPLMAATVQADGRKFIVVARKPAWNSNPPSPYSYTGPRGYRNYDLSPDNQRFLVLKDVKRAGAAETTEQIFLVQNWTEELKRRVPGRGNDWIFAGGKNPR